MNLDDLGINRTGAKDYQEVAYIIINLMVTYCDRPGCSRERRCRRRSVL